MSKWIVVTYKISPTSNYKGDEGVDGIDDYNLFVSWCFSVDPSVLLDLGVDKQVITTFAFKGREVRSFNALSPPIIVLKHTP
jgi:hypothetical protein